PAQTSVSSLAACPNVRLLGARAHADLPGYIKAFDVGLVPYEVTDYTAKKYPAKLNEYLAMGVPVGSTDLPEIRKFNLDHGDVIAIARDTRSFTDAIESAVATGTNDAPARRVAVARANSWKTRIDQMSALIEPQLIGPVSATS